MGNVNAFMNEYAAGNRGRIDEGHPLYMAGYSAGITQGRELEREQRKQRGLAMSISVTDMDIFHDLLNLTKNLFDQVSEEQQQAAQRQIDKLIGATHDISDFNQRGERRA